MRRFPENIVSMKGYTKKLMDGDKNAINWHVAKGPDTLSPPLSSYNVDSGVDVPFSQWKTQSGTL